MARHGLPSSHLSLSLSNVATLPLLFFFCKLKEENWGGCFLSLSPSIACMEHFLKEGGGREIVSWREFHVSGMLFYVIHVLFVLVHMFAMKCQQVFHAQKCCHVGLERKKEKKTFVQILRVLDTAK